MAHQVTGYSVHVSFIPDPHGVKPALANYPSLSFFYSFVNVGQNTLAKIPVYSLGLVAALTNYVVVVKADVVLCAQPKSVIFPLPIPFFLIQK